MKIGEVFEFILTVAREAGVPYTMAVTLDEEPNGFYSNSKFQADMVKGWVIHAPKSTRRLSRAVRLTLRHEVGHALFTYLWMKDEAVLQKAIAGIPWWFRYLQRQYYWSPVLRLMKRTLGFSTKIRARAGDTIGEGPFKMWEMECFCDWFAVGKVKA